MTNKKPGSISFIFEHILIPGSYSLTRILIRTTPDGLSNGLNIWGIFQTHFPNMPKMDFLNSKKFLFKIFYSSNMSFNLQFYSKFHGFFRGPSTLLQHKEFLLLYSNEFQESNGGTNYPKSKKNI